MQVMLHHLSVESVLLVNPIAQFCQFLRFYLHSIRLPYARAQGVHSGISPLHSHFRLVSILIGDKSVSSPASVSASASVFVLLVADLCRPSSSSFSPFAPCFHSLALFLSSNVLSFFCFVLFLSLLASFLYPFHSYRNRNSISLWYIKFWPGLSILL